MPCWKVRGKGWRFQFQHLGQRHSGQWYATKKEAAAAEAAKRRELAVEAKEARKATPKTFFQTATAYLEDAQRRFATKTWKYKRFVFRSFLAHAGDLPLEQLTVPLIEGYLKTRHSNVNYNRHRKDLCALFTWCWKRRLYWRPGRKRPFLETIYYSMARVDEILRLRWQDVNFSKRQITLWTRKRKDGSWQGDEIPMHPNLYPVLKRLWDKRTSDEYVFINPKTGTRYMSRPKLMRGLCKLAGVQPFGFHALRHFVASYLDDIEKVSMKKLQELLRHKSQRTTEKYLQSVDQGSHAALGRLPAPENLANLLTEPTHKQEAVAEATAYIPDNISGDEGI